MKPSWMLLAAMFTGMLAVCLLAFVSGESDGYARRALKDVEAFDGLDGQIHSLQKECDSLRPDAERARDFDRQLRAAGLFTGLADGQAVRLQPFEHGPVNDLPPEMSPPATSQAMPYSRKPTIR